SQAQEPQHRQQRPRATTPPRGLREEPEILGLVHREGNVFGMQIGHDITSKQRRNRSRARSSATVEPATCLPACQLPEGVGRDGSSEGGSQGAPLCNESTVISLLGSTT